jgi:hypothetical protein
MDGRRNLGSWWGAHERIDNPDTIAHWQISFVKE